MAKYLGLSTSDARGAQGGIVFSRNRYGVYTRGRVSPVNPRSTPQVEARNVLEAFSIAWRAITADNQAQWNSVAATITWFDSLGQGYSPSGHQLFISVNANRTLVGQGERSQPIDPYGVPAAPAGLSVSSLTSSVFTIDFSNTLGTNLAVAAYATPPLSQGVSFFKPSSFRFMGWVENSDGEPHAIDIAAAYIAYFGATPTTGSRVAVRLRVISKLSGYASAQAQVAYDVP